MYQDMCGFFATAISLIGEEGPVYDKSSAFRDMRFAQTKLAKNVISCSVLLLIGDKCVNFVGIIL